MKNLLCICIIIVAFQAAAFTQCGVNYKEMMEKYCTGVYLQHQELGNTNSRKVSFMFKEGDRYAIYLLNPSKMLPEYTLAGSKPSALQEVISNVNKKEKFSSYVFTAGETGEYELSYNFGTKEDVCVLMAIYLQNVTLFKPGVYNTFEEMKYNNPSAPIDHKILSRTIKVGGTQIIYYKLELNNKKATAKEKYYGFSDGKSIYIRQKEGAGLTREFVKIDHYGKYGLFEDVAYVYTGTVSVPFVTHNILDMNTGTITRIDKKYVRELLAVDPELLESFNNESRKDTKLREYIVRYLTK